MNGGFPNTVNHEESEKYPPNIQKLFAAGLPIPYVPPIDYPIECRKTTTISPISNYKSLINTHVEQLNHQTLASPNQTLNSSIEAARIKKINHQKSFERQLNDWNNPQLLAKNEQEFMKDPYKTVFISRLDYKLTEIDISNGFNNFGPINSIKIIRDINSNKSRGYGFIVFEKDLDAKNCVRELAATGIKLPGTSRTILVDMERGRLIRNWKPRRLGGGLGGRNYSKPEVISGNSRFDFNPNASAAASGRRMNLSLNPYQDKFKSQSQGHSRYKSASPPVYPPQTYPPQAFSSSQPPYASQLSFSSQLAYSSRSIKDKYSSYSRSSKSIRQRD